MIQPSYREFAKLAKQGNVIPVYEEILMDLETPLSFYDRLKKNRHSFLLESVEGSERWARYSFLGTAPELVFKAWGHKVEITRGRKTESRTCEDPLKELEKLLDGYQPAVSLPDLPFTGGALGYVAYDSVEVLHGVPNKKERASRFPDVYFLLVRTLVSFDNLKHTITIIDNVPIKRGASLRSLYGDSVSRIENLQSSLRKSPKTLGARSLTGLGSSIKYNSNVTPQRFRAMVRRGKEYIAAGDAIQVVLSQRLETHTQVEPFEIYRALRFTNPSPYMFFLELEDLKIIGSSPEILVRLTGRDIELRPIAGTRPRGRDAQSERDLEENLLADTKERAEHIMLVDLGRNDVGRVAKVGSVEVDQLMTIERYSHVMHIVSNIKAELDQGKTPLDLFASCFPAGTVSGAPKVRAMQIISELEPQRRGLYAGAVGYMSFNNNLDTCIAIRTITVHNGTAVIQAGAGIVADSDPTAEYNETLSKARGMLKAIGLAESWRKEQ